LSLPLSPKGNGLVTEDLDFLFNVFIY